jgi:crossover junction endodeoxyribonuclease RuvC
MIVGVDIGNTGAVALLDDRGELLEVHDMPCLADGPKGRPAVNAALLAGIVAKARPTKAYVELVGPRPGEGSAGAFSFGRARGVVEGVLGAAGVSVSFLTPAVWKRLHSIPPGRDQKDLARSKAIARWPAQAGLFSRVKDADRAEACLIAVAGLVRAERPPVDERERAHGHLPAG